MCISAAALAGAFVVALPAARADGAGCGAPCAGSCFSVSGSPGCDIQVCCETVCAQLPFCCMFAWSEPCAAAAADLCGGDLPCDCNGNGVPDDADIADGTCSDDNGNGMPDDCEHVPDCNANGIPDTCDVDPADPDDNGLVSQDADGNGVPDECEDCNSNGVLDGMDIDPGDPDGDGHVSFDCDGDGVPDECAVQCDVDVVFVLDPSCSMYEVLSVICADLIVPTLNALGETVAGQLTGTVLGVADQWAECATGTVIEQLGRKVPGVPGSCCSPICPAGSNCNGNWGGATAIVAQRFAWSPQALRIIVSVVEDGPCDGWPCEDPGPDREAIENAVGVVQEHRALVYLVTASDSGECAMALADELGARTGGRAWHPSSGITWTQIGAELAAEIEARSAAHCAVCDVDGDGIPSACECPSDLDCDGTVGITEFLDLLAAWGA
ncbi:MAG: hypothetical protein ACYTES_19560, partial [Planctomycetota bacterium]